jgi:hypothetical protein
MGGSPLVIEQLATDRGRRFGNARADGNPGIRALSPMQRMRNFLGS